MMLDAAQAKVVAYIDSDGSILSADTADNEINRFFIDSGHAVTSL